MREPVKDAVLVVGGIAVATVLGLVLILTTESALLGSGVVLAAALLAGIWYAARRSPDDARFAVEFMRRRRR